MALIHIQNAGVEATVLLNVGGRIVSFHRVGKPNVLESDPSLWDESERLHPSPTMLDKKKEKYIKEIKIIKKNKNK